MFSSTASIQADSLASLALYAANELDRMERGRDADINRVNNLLDAVAKFSGSINQSPASSLALDPTGSKMFNVAASKASGQLIKSFDELTDLVRDWKSHLNSPEKGVSIRELKEFCLSIHRFVVRSRTHNTPFESGVFDYDDISH